MAKRRNWTAIGFGLEVIAGVAVTISIMLAIPVALVGLGAIVWGLFPTQTKKLGQKLLGKSIGPREYISLHEAATRAYEETEETLVAWAAETPLPNGNKAVLSWCAYALVGKNRQTPIFGKRVPSRVRRRIKADELKQGHFGDDARTFTTYGKTEPEFVDLEIKEADFQQRLEEIKTWAGGDAEPDDREETPFPDMTIKELFYYIGNDTDFLDAESEILTDENWIKIGDEIRDQASVGRLTFWGRVYGKQWGKMFGKNPLTEISKEYWKEGKFTYQFFEEGEKDPPHTHQQGDDEGLRDLRVNRSQVMQIWPSKNKSAAGKPLKRSLPSWSELETRFKELETALKGAQIIAQSGSSGEHWRLAPVLNHEAKRLFEVLATMAGERLLQDFPAEVEKHQPVKMENDPLIRWYKALANIAQRYEFGQEEKERKEDGSFAGLLHTGYIRDPASASATFCLELASKDLENGTG